MIHGTGEKKHGVGGGHGSHHHGGGWPRGYGWGWGWGGYAPLYDTAPITIDVDTSTSGASRCKLKAGVTYTKASGITKTIPAGTIVQSIPDSNTSIKIKYDGQWIRVSKNVCEMVSGFSYADGGGNTSFASAQSDADRLMIEKKVQAWFVLTGMGVGLYLAYKHKHKSLLDFALMAVFGAGGGALVGWVAKGNVATLLTKKQTETVTK